MSIDCQTETRGAFRQVIRVGAHTMHADIATALGGADSAPSPHDYFDSALAACKALTALIYARRHGMALDRVEIHVERDATKEREGTYLLRVGLGFFGDLSETDRQKLHEIADRCPVHKLMTKTDVVIASALL